MQQPYRFNDSRAAYEQIEEEVLIIDLETGTYYSLRETAAALWLNAVAGAPGDLLAHALIAHYGESNRDLITHDLAAFLDGLLEAGLLVPIEDAPVVAVTWAVPLPATYRAPVVERYDDMQALLLIDPIHDVDMTGWPALPAAKPAAGEPAAGVPGQAMQRAGR